MSRWIKGRQGSGYFKLPLIVSERLKFDAYILKYPDTSFVSPHIDAVVEGRHFRANLILVKPKAGGNFLCENMIINWPRLKVFRPDRDTHEVTEIFGSTRWVLSIGWIRP